MRKSGGLRALNVAIWSDGRPLHGLLRVRARARGIALLLDIADALGLVRALASAGFASIAIELARAEAPEGEAPAIAELCSGLFDATQWLRTRAETRGLPQVCIASGPSAAAAVIEAARQPDLFKGLVLREAALQDAGPWIGRLRVPVLYAKDHAGSDDIVAWLLKNPAESAQRTPIEMPDPSLGRRNCGRDARALFRELRAARRSTCAH